MDRKIEKRNWPPKKVAWVASTTLIVILVSYNLLFGDRSSKLNIQSNRIRISQAEAGEFQEFIPVTGAIIPIQTIYLDAVEGGRVEERYLEAGTYVEKGDEILLLSNLNLLLDIMYREAELFQQSNNLRNTRLAMEQRKLELQSQLIDLNYQLLRNERDDKRNVELLAKKLISQRDFDLVHDEHEYLVARRSITMQSHVQDSLYRFAQVEQLESSLARMTSNLELVKQNIENLTLRAPVSGHLTSLNAEIGESKVRGQRLGQIDVLDGFKVRVPVDEHYITRVDVGQTGSFPLGGTRYSVVVHKIFPEVTNGQFQIDMQFEGEIPTDVRRGQTLRIRLALGDLSDALLLARGAFFQKTGGRWVYVVDPSNEYAIKRDIVLGNQNQDYYEVLSGLAPGERVITSSYDNFGDVDKLILKK